MMPLPIYKSINKKVWSRLIRDFAAVGYDHSNMILASYDWRLSLHDMERRDHYFTILKARIETLVKISGGRKVRAGM